MQRWGGLEKNRLKTFYISLYYKFFSGLFKPIKEPNTLNLKY